MPARIPLSLPPLRTKIRRSFSALTILYALLGVFMAVSVYLAIGVTPKAIHLNYDSIEAAMQMEQAWNALRNPEQFATATGRSGEGRDARLPPPVWVSRFEKALTFELGNITEPGEAELAKETEALWARTKPLLLASRAADVALTDVRRMHELLNGVVTVNQVGMFKLAEENNSFGKKVFFASLVFFLASLVLSILLGDGLAARLAQPLKDMAEILREGPDVGARLRLPAPTTLEMRVLTHEMTSLWERLALFRKSNITELAAQTERLQTVLASVEDAILVLDNRGSVLHCSDGMLKLLELGLTDVTGHPWADLPTGNANYLRLRGLLTPALEGDNAVELAVAGKRLVYAGRQREIAATDGSPIGQLYLLHDITEMRHRERLKAEFIEVLSHELKTPLQSLGTAAELLAARKNQVDGDAAILIDTVNEDVSRIRAVANDFMQVGLADRHSLKLRLERLPFSQLLEEWLKPFKVLARDKGVQVACARDSDNVVWGNIDAIKLPWAISNLLANAIRVSKAGQTVTVVVNDRVSTEYFEVDIVDEGPGIPPEVQKRMFEPYYQAPKGTTGAATGFLGLGLTIAKEVVEAHEGRIEYVPRKPSGSIFRITLPAVSPVSA